MPPRIYKYPTHRKGGMGRLKVDWPPVPDVPEYRIHAVDEWLTAERGWNKKFPATPHLFAIICALYLAEHPLPPRRALATAIKCNIFTVDAAISTGMGNDEIQEVFRYEEGDVYHRASIRRRRYLVPCKQLLDAYNDAVRPRAQATSIQLVG